MQYKGEARLECDSEKCQAMDQNGGGPSIWVSPKYEIMRDSRGSGQQHRRSFAASGKIPS